MDATSGAAIVLMVASGAGWWAARRLPMAPNVERLRRVAKVVLAGSVGTVIAAVIYVVLVGLDDPTPGSGWIGPGRAMLLAMPALVLWVATIPRTWVLVRGRRSADPLSWVGPALRAEVSSAVFAVPPGASFVAALLVLLAPAALVDQPYGLGFLGLGLALALAATTIDALHRRRRSRAEPPAAVPVLVGTARVPTAAQ